uniref:Uncharacterized protein n=1 Tax=Anguilla anguilla TaxID=7936 RepID=A0A0E9Q7E6_ANGAN
MSLRIRGSTEYEWNVMFIFDIYHSLFMLITVGLVDMYHQWKTETEKVNRRTSRMSVS